ncbi:hypothetical protein V6N13_055819 [Hibiscus sabdariffa]
MVREDKNYEEASFAFYISDCGFSFEVEKCGVKVFYVDVESNTITDASFADVIHSTRMLILKTMRISSKPITILLQKQASAVLVVKKETEGPKD